MTKEAKDYVDDKASGGYVKDNTKDAQRSSNKMVVEPIIAQDLGGPDKIVAGRNVGGSNNILLIPFKALGSRIFTAPNLADTSFYSDSVRCLAITNVRLVSGAKWSGDFAGIVDFQSGVFEDINVDEIILRWQPIPPTE